MDHSEELQAAVFGFLADPLTHGGVEVRRIDTHASAVFLAGPRALKVKRAVRFPFLDYSTLDKRHAACTQEIAVNRPFAPQIYRGVVAITKGPDGRQAIGGSGPPVEWAVDMVRFDETRTLDRLADAGSIDAALADKLGHAVAVAHAGAPQVDAGPWIAAVEEFVAQNAVAFGERPDLFPLDQAAELTRRSRQALATIVPMLHARGRQGLTRRGHGDLHLGNIALIDGEPVAFDAIEFDPLIAAGDVLYDLAFLLMDLVERSLVAAANIVLNRYLVETRRPEDLDALKVLPFFLSLRAAIRAKVTAARLDHAPPAAREAIACSAITYFRLACRLMAPAPPSLVAIGGLSGTGKSLLARALAPELDPVPGAVVLRSDVERKLTFGVGETARLPPRAYEPDVTAQVYASLCDKARRAVAAGHSVIVDAVFAEEAERAMIAAAAVGQSIAFRGLFLTADLAIRLRRVSGRGPDASDADAAVARRQEVYRLGKLDWTGIDASGTPQKTLALARAALR
jgi:aminoglycoside phosphotransferase family enzyme/predicted kinase